MGRVLRGVSRTGEGGRGTPIIAYCETKERAQEAREMVGGKNLDITDELA